LAVKDSRINEQIKVKEVRLIDENNEQKGVVSILDARKMAETAGLDLVEIAPNAEPPVCKILNYSKYKFDVEKKLREQKRNQKLTKLKEIKMQPKIEKHDLEFKAKHVQEFIDGGNKVKITIRFRGRELAHTERGFGVFDKLLEILTEGSFVIDSQPRMEGRFMSMQISPKKK
jgi:translation initiation factor IF-3